MRLVAHRNAHDRKRSHKKSGEGEKISRHVPSLREKTRESIHISHSILRSFPKNNRTISSLSRARSRANWKIKLNKILRKIRANVYDDQRDATISNSIFTLYPLYRSRSMWICALVDAIIRDILRSPYSANISMEIFFFKANKICTKSNLRQRTNNRSF